MIRGRQPRERCPRIQLDREADGIQRAPRRVLDRGRDPRGVGHLDRIGRPAGAAGRSGHRCARDVAWTHHHREAQTELARVVSNGLLVLDLDRDRGAGRDVRDRRREDVGPLLLDEARAPALVFRLLVLRLGRRPLLNHALDQPVADLHAEMVDRGVLGQREDVDALRPRGAGVRELLTNARPRDDAGHHDVDVGLERRRRDGRALLGASPEQRALGDAVRTSTRVTGDLRPGGRSRQDEDQTDEDQSSNAPHGSDYRSPAGEVDSRRHRGGELAKLEMHPAVDLLALLARVVAQRPVRSHRDHLDRRLRDAQVDEEALHHLSSTLSQAAVVLGRALVIGVALDHHDPRVGQVHPSRRLLEHAGRVGAKARALEVEVDVGVEDSRRRRGNHGTRARRRRGSLSHIRARAGRRLDPLRVNPVRSDRSGDHREEDPDEDHQLLHTTDLLPLHLAHCPVPSFSRRRASRWSGRSCRLYGRRPARDPEQRPRHAGRYAFVVRECNDFRDLGVRSGGRSIVGTRGIPASPHSSRAAGRAVRPWRSASGARDAGGRGAPASGSGARGGS